MIRKIFLVAIICLNLFAQDTMPTTQNKIENTMPPKITVSEGIPAETNSSLPENWNVLDWKKHVENEANTSMPLNNSLPTNAQATVGSVFQQHSDIAFSGNYNELSSQALIANESLSGDNSIQNGYTSDFENSMIEESIDNPFVNLIDIPDTISCYIARDISFRWECPIDNMVYGGDIQSDGREARLKCENGCYSQKPCVNVGTADSNSTQEYLDLLCDFTANPSGCTYSYALSANGIRTINASFLATPENKQKYKLSVSTINDGNKFENLVTNMNNLIFDNNMTIRINKIAKNISFNISPILENNTTVGNVLINKITINMKENQKWICPSLQNIEVYEDNNMTYNCPSGNIVSLVGANSNSYSICNDGLYPADNQDGTFSSEQMCISMCKTGVKCEPNTTTMTTSTLEHSFREACLEGQPNCSNSNYDCKNARLSNEVIVNETVFDASRTPIITIQNSIAVAGTSRPRISNTQTGSETESEYQIIHREEWKDEAFQDMVNSAKYVISKTKIGEDSNSSSGYRKGITSGANYGQSSLSGVNSLSWNLKPKALDANNGQSYKLYALFEANIFYSGYNIEGNAVKKAKKVWYVKDSGSDVFHGIKFGDDIGYYELQKNVDENNITTLSKEFFPNIHATIDYKRFNTFSETWVAYSPASTLAPAFSTMVFDAQHQLPYWNIPLVENLNSLAYTMEGFVRRREPVPSSTKHYTGVFDGTGDGLLSLKVYVGYDINDLSYEEIFQKIDNEEFHEIYSMLEERLYKNAPRSDSSNTQLIDLYQYGPSNNTTIYATIKTKEEDIGKKGFIYVFFQ